MPNQRPVCLVGGGTGGHITPLIAIAEELERRGESFYFIGDRNGPEQDFIKDRKWPFYGISAGKWRRYSGIKPGLANFQDIGRSFLGFILSLKILLSNRPRVVFSKGGYVSLPVILAGWLLRVPIVIHESDAVLGATNKIAAILARRVLTLFPLKNIAVKSDKLSQVGLPLRRSFLQAATLKGPRKSRPLILILPGSQGSSAINEVIFSVLPQLLQLIDVVHMTGKNDQSTAEKYLAELPKKLAMRYKVFSFIDRELPYYFQAADILLARASATTLSEAALFRKATVAIPLPSAASDHQRKNAAILTANDAIIAIEQSDFSGDVLLKIVGDLLDDDKRRQGLGDRLNRALLVDEATDRCIKEINDAEKN